MLGIDLLLLVIGGALIVGAATLVGARLERRNEARRRRLLGERNAAAEKQRLEEQCAACGESIDPNQDVWDLGRWWHRECYREVIR